MTTQSENRKKLQFWVSKDFPIDSKELKVITLNLPKLMKYCKFSKEAKIIYMNTEGLRAAFEKLIPKKKEDD